MRTIKFSPVMRALAVCIGTLAFAGAQPTRPATRAAYDSAKASAKSDATRPPRRSATP